MPILNRYAGPAGVSAPDPLRMKALKRLAQPPGGRGGRSSALAGPRVPDEPIRTGREGPVDVKRPPLPDTTSRVQEPPAQPATLTGAQAIKVGAAPRGAFIEPTGALGAPTQPPPKDVAPDTAGTDVESLTQQQAREREAAQAEFKATRQKALGDVAARAGLGGFGLSGASAALASDVGRQQQRAETLGLAQLRQQQLAEQRKTLQFDATLDELEAEQGRDIDGDGQVAGRPVVDVERENFGQQKLDEVLDAAVSSGSGTAEDPLIADPSIAAWVKLSGATLKSRNRGVEVWVLPDGRFVSITMATAGKDVQDVRRKAGLPAPQASQSTSDLLVRGTGF